MNKTIEEFYNRAYIKKRDQILGQGGNWQDLGVIRLAVKFGQPRVILDIGCGTGTILKMLSAIPNVEKLIGIDLSLTAVNEARARLPLCEIYHGTVENMEHVKNKSCDVIIAHSVFEHVFDTHRMINEINRVLKPNGIVSIYTIDFNLLKKIIVGLFAFEKCFDVCGGHIRFFTRKSLQNVMMEHGFELLHHEWDATYFGIMPHGQNAVYRKTKEVSLLGEYASV